MLISLLLSALLISGALQWYQVLKKTVITGRDKAQTLEIGRVVFQYVMKDVSTGGYQGCRTLDPAFPIRNHVGVFGTAHNYFRRDRVVFGFQATLGYCQGRMPKTICDRVKENSDLLIIYNVPRKIYSLIRDMRSAKENIYVQPGKPIQSGSMVLISDCNQGDVFIANTVEKQSIFHTDNLSKAYKQHAEAAEIQTIAYYLGIPERYKENQKSYALYRDDLLQEAEELIEGVVDFEVQYAFWDPVLGIQYKMASALGDADWAQVVGIRLKIRTNTNHSWEYELAIRNR